MIHQNGVAIGPVACFYGLGDTASSNPNGSLFCYDTRSQQWSAAAASTPHRGNTNHTVTRTHHHYTDIRYRMNTEHVVNPWVSKSSRFKHCLVTWAGSVAGGAMVSLGDVVLVAGGYDPTEIKATDVIDVFSVKSA